MKSNEMRSARHGGWALAILSLAAIGCHREGPAFLPTWGAAQRFYTPRARSSNGYDSLALAAEDVQKSVNAKYIDRVFFTPAMRDAVIKQSSSAVSRVAGGLQKPVDFEFTAHGPFEDSPNDRGWRVIDRALLWRIQKECANNNYDAAVGDEITATKFGLSLTGGDAMDASLGFATADDGRRALTPNLQSLGASQLNRLASGLQSALNSEPPLSKTFENEKQNMLLSVQFVQDSFLRNDFGDIRKQLGPDIKDSIDYLGDLRDKSSTKQAAYFQGFANEANETARWLGAISSLPLAERKHDPGPQLEKDRPWKTFAKHFFSAGEPLLSMRDATLARTRLMILESRILAMVKSGQQAPRDLSGFDRDLTTDPYAGRQFVYRASGRDFTIYSVGEDLKDDGGDTDETFSSPDLSIEMPQS